MSDILDIDKIIANSTVRGFCNGGAGKCTGIVNRAIPATISASPGCNGPQDVGIWVHKNGGNKYYQEVDPKAVVANPQLGDILIYRNPNGGATWSRSNSTHGYSAGDRIGHTVMWLPWPHNKSNVTWICDHEQSRKSPTWWTYGANPGKFDCMRAFRFKGQITFNGQTFQSKTLPDVADCGPYGGGLAGHKDDLQSATSVSGDGSFGDGSYIEGGGMSVGGGGGGGVYLVYGQNYGTRVIKEGEANTVYQLASEGERMNVLTQSKDRKSQFKSMVNDMVQQVPNRERDIIVSSEMYDSSIMKTTQSSKQERKVKK